MAERVWLSLDLVEAATRAAKASGVSRVATSRGGFVSAYRRAAGEPSQLGRHSKTGQPWRDRRNGFVARHLAQVEGQAEPLWRNGAPTARHLALAVWAYSPHRARLRAWLRNNGYL